MEISAVKLALPTLESVRSNYVWDSRAGNREEVWLDESGRPYRYGAGAGERTYEAQRFKLDVGGVMAQLNEYWHRFDVCVLNYYWDKKCAIGWHSDDSPEMDNSHPIVVVSLGGPRYLDYRPIGEKDFTRVLLEDGSVFVMKAGDQQVYEHRIPKYDKEAEPRLSMTFRRYL